MMPCSKSCFFFIACKHYNLLGFYHSISKIMAKQIHSSKACWLVNNVSKSTFIGKNIVSQNSLGLAKRKNIKMANDNGLA